jgi:hypothetical protein
MKAYDISEAGGPEKLVLTDIDTPKAKPGWVLVKVRALRPQLYPKAGRSRRSQSEVNFNTLKTR